MIYLPFSVLGDIYYYIYSMGQMKKQLEEIMTFDQLRTDDEFMYNEYLKNQKLDNLVFDLEFFNN
jgi:hypothetical protein